MGNIEIRLQAMEIYRCVLLKERRQGPVTLSFNFNHSKNIKFDLLIQILVIVEVHTKKIVHFVVQCCALHL